MPVIIDHNEEDGFMAFCVRELPDELINVDVYLRNDNVTLCRGIPTGLCTIEGTTDLCICTRPTNGKFYRSMINVNEWDNGAKAKFEQKLHNFNKRYFG